MQDEPRALVALSEDRQWLVVLPPKAAHWHVYQFVQPGGFYFQTLSHGWRDQLLNTGQDAHEVLREFLEGRDEAQR